MIGTDPLLVKDRRILFPRDLSPLTIDDMFYPLKVVTTFSGYDRRGSNSVIP